MPQRIGRRAVWAAGLGSLLSGLACAQPQRWPVKPIRVIVPAAPGGAYDRTLRPLAEALAVELGQPVIVDNRAGAGNIVGTQAGAAAPPDGYTLTMTGMVNTIAQGLYDRVPFDIVSDFEHIVGIGGGAQMLVARQGSGIRSLGDLIEQARRSPGKLDYASSGQGSAGHLLMELLQRAVGVKLVHVPYKSGAPALQDVLAGVVPLTVIPVAGAHAHVLSGALEPLAVSSPKRQPDLPQVPTFAELGYPMLTVISWVGLSAPRGTSADIVLRIRSAVRLCLSQQELAAKLLADGLRPLPQTDYAALVKSDTERWGQLTRSLGLKAQ